MQVTETLSEGLKRGFTVVVPAADIEERRARRLAELGKTVNLPGFRPGKVPALVVKQRYGTAVAAEVLEESVNDATRQVLSDRGLRAAMQPKVDVISLEDKRDLEFKVEVELLPEIAMPEFKAIELTRLTAEPAAEAIDTALGEIAKRNAELVAVEEVRPAAKGEVLSVDFVGKVDGVAFPGGTGTDMDVEVAGPGFIPGFTEQVEGMTPGESRTIHVTFPDGYGEKSLAGKAATFDITAKALKTRVVGAIDDELAKKLGFESVERVRDLISQQMRREYDQMSRLRLKRQLLDALAAAAPFAVPEGMVDAEFAQIWQRIEADRAEGKLDEEDKSKSEDVLKGEYRAIAERRVRLGLLLSEIGRVNGITVAADEMTRAMRAEAGRYPGQEAQVMEFFRKNPQAAEGLRGPIFEEKVVDFVLELARVTDQVVPVEELARDPEAGPAAVGQPG
ncbi:MAG: trigger factor [Rhodospirillales bacterium]|nr:trigger factor [Rhodospirillales bacterium]MDE2199351.1 trigger factor [Rhodospirillales bacterium]MDE2574059.1 trigger factor [Rhodospirillales bacterium]